MAKLYFLGFFLYLLITVNAKFCDTNEDCNEGFLCTSRLCTCGIGQFPDNKGENCLNVSGMGLECIEDVQCITSIKGPSLCTKDFLCGCKPGYRYINNICTAIQGYGGYCASDADCYDGININALKCDNNECVCNKGFYLRGDSDCRLSGKENKTCLFDIDCESDVEYCKFIFGPLGDCVSKLDPENNSTDIQNVDKKIYTIDEDIIVPRKVSPLNRIDIDCTSDAHCSGIENSICAEYKKKCSCKDGFVYNKYKNICVKGLGAPCYNTDCPIIHTYCNENKICACKDYFIESNYYDKCLKPARGLNMSCGRDENCYSLGLYGTCNKNKCECKKNSVFDEEIMLCRPTGNEETGCENNCEHKLHSTCVNNYCHCEDNYEDGNNKCLPNIGFECSETINDCVIKNAKCNNNICECEKGYLKSDNRTCVKEIDDNDECTADIQCEYNLGFGGICLSENNTCTCAPDYMRMVVNKKDACVMKRQLGERCSSNIHCKTILRGDHVVCRNSMCVCDYNSRLITDEDGQRCENGSSIVFLSSLLIWSLVSFLIAFN